MRASSMRNWACSYERAPEEQMTVLWKDILRMRASASMTVVDDVMESLKGMTLLEASELVKAIEEMVVTLKQKKQDEVAHRDFCVRD